MQADRNLLLEDFFENGAIGLHVVGADGSVLDANKAELNLLGYAREEYVGRPISDFHLDGEVISDILARLGRGETLDKYAARLRAKDGSVKHVLISSSVCFDPSGRFLHTRCFTLDVTDQIHAQKLLSEAQQRLAATYEHALAGISEIDAEGRLLRTNDGLARLTGYTKEELSGRSVFDITHPDDLEEDLRQYRRQVSGEIDRYTIERRYIKSDGAPLWVHIVSTSVRGSAGEFLYGVRVATDIHELKLADERRKLLINELNHRVKNTLATVQSFAQQTARRSREIDDFMERFEGRLMALSNAHDRLTRRNWEGASLREIVQEELALHGGAERGLSIDGPDVALEPRTALSISMALHELGTNATKYGALSTPEGRIRVAWEVHRDLHSRPVSLSIAWIETGGPTVETPSDFGFGARLLDAISSELNGKSSLKYLAEGVRWEIDLPLPVVG